MIRKSCQNVNAFNCFLKSIREKWFCWKAKSFKFRFSIRQISNKSKFPSISKIFASVCLYRPPIVKILLTVIFSVKTSGGAWWLLITVYFFKKFFHKKYKISGSFSFVFSRRRKKKVTIHFNLNISLTI